MADVSPITASAVNGRVLIDVDPATAQDLADVIVAFYEASEVRQRQRPGWFGDVVELIAAAGRADAQAAAARRSLVEVPVVRFDRPQLRVVGGDGS